MPRSRLVVAALMAGVALISYFASREVNTVTGETQHIAISQEQEVALGLQSAPQMAAELGGPDSDGSVQADVESVGQRVVGRVAGKTPYRFRFQVLSSQTINAFALPGGPVFITRALLASLENEAQLAGVLGHEVGHVIGRHAAEHLTKSQLAQGLVGAVGVAASDDRGRGQQAAQVAAVVAHMVQLKYGRGDELEADSLGIGLMSDAGYDPRALVDVMAILARSSDGNRQPEFLSSHPDPGNRQERIREVIAKRFPGGVPAGLKLGQRITLRADSSSR